MNHITNNKPIISTELTNSSGKDCTSSDSTSSITELFNDRVSPPSTSPAASTPKKAKKKKSDFSFKSLTQEDPNNCLSPREKAANYFNKTNPLQEAITADDFDAAIELIGYYEVSISTVEEGKKLIAIVQAAEVYPPQLTELIAKQIAFLENPPLLGLHPYDKQGIVPLTHFISHGAIPFISQNLAERLTLIATLMSPKKTLETPYMLNLTREEQALIVEFARQITLQTCHSYHNSEIHKAAAKNLIVLRKIKPLEESTLSASLDPQIATYLLDKGIEFLSKNPESHSKMVAAILMNDPKAFNNILKNDAYNVEDLAQYKALFSRLATFMLSQSTQNKAEYEKSLTLYQLIQKHIGSNASLPTSNTTRSSSSETLGDEIELNSKLFEDEISSIDPLIDPSVAPLSLKNIFKASELLKHKEIQDALCNAIDNKDYETALVFANPELALDCLYLLLKQLDDCQMGDIFDSDLLEQLEECIYSGSDPTYTLASDILKANYESRLTAKDKQNLQRIFDQFYAILSFGLDQEVIDETRYQYALELIEAFQGLGINTQKSSDKQMVYNEGLVTAFTLAHKEIFKQINRSSILDQIVTFEKVPSFLFDSDVIDILPFLKKQEQTPVITALLNTLYIKLKKRFSPPQSPAPQATTSTSQPAPKCKNIENTELKSAAPISKPATPHLQFSSIQLEQLSTTLNKGAWEEAYQNFYALSPSQLNEEVKEDLVRIKDQLKALKLPNCKKQAQTFKAMFEQHGIRQGVSLQELQNTFLYTRTLRKGALDAPQFIRKYPNNTVVHALYTGRFDIALALMEKEVALKSVQEITTLVPNKKDFDLVRAKYAQKTYENGPQNLTKKEEALIADHISQLNQVVPFLPQEGDLFVKYLKEKGHSIQKANQYKELSKEARNHSLRLFGRPLDRVKRWLEIDESKGIEAVRYFTDRDDQGNFIHKYQNKSLDELLILRRAHVAPGIEGIFTKPEWENIYWHKEEIITDGITTGHTYRMNAVLIAEGKYRTGTFEYCINTTKEVFHSYFNTTDNKLSEILKNHNLKIPVGKIDPNWTAYGMANFRQIDDELIVHFTGDLNIKHSFLIKPLIRKAHD